MKSQDMNQFEQPFFFENNCYKIFAILHSPKIKILNKAFLFCYPFGFEGDTCRRIYANFARRLALKGFYILRFNYMGTGDSSGNFKDSTIETHISDITKAIYILREKSGVQEIGILGMRLGATLAGLAAINTEAKVEHLILWDPIINVRKFFDDGFRQAITFQTVLFQKIFIDRKQIIDKLLSGENPNYQGYGLNFIDGFEISSDFYQQAIAIDLLEHIINYYGNILLVQINKNNEPLRDELLNLQKLCKSKSKNLYLTQAKEPIPWWIPEGEIRVSEPKQIFDITENWISKIITPV